MAQGGIDLAERSATLLTVSAAALAAPRCGAHGCRMRNGRTHRASVLVRKEGGGLAGPQRALHELEEQWAVGAGRRVAIDDGAAEDGVARPVVLRVWRQVQCGQWSCRCCGRSSVDSGPSGVVAGAVWTAVLRAGAVWPVVGAVQQAGVAMPVVLQVQLAVRHGMAGTAATRVGRCGCKVREQCSVSSAGRMVQDEQCRVISKRARERGRIAEEGRWAERERGRQQAPWEPCLQAAQANGHRLAHLNVLLGCNLGPSVCVDRGDFILLPPHRACSVIHLSSHTIHTMCQGGGAQQLSLCSVRSNVHFALDGALVSEEKARPMQSTRPQHDELDFAWVGPPAVHFAVDHPCCPGRGP
eukprot:362868-Chlamydomonas_euryale.AAC.2